MSRPTSVSIDRAAFIHNIQVVRRMVAPAKIMAIVKSNAYGHGSLLLKSAYDYVDALAVCSVGEALILREGGVNNPIVLLEGFFDVSELSQIIANDFQVFIHDVRQIEILERTQLAKPIKVWLKIDSGMHRLGIAPQEAKQLYQRLVKCANVVSPPGLVTHFACADEFQNDYTRQQLEIFNTAVTDLSGERCLANSAGILNWPESHGDWVRPGIMLYGISPFAEHIGAGYGLKPVMTLRSKLIAIHDLQRGDLVGYGSTWRCPEPMRIGVVAIGYGDGYPRHAVNGTPVLVNGHEVPLAGRVSMDMLTVDLRSQPNARINDPVVLWGQGLPVERVAQCCGTIGYELVCGIARRVKLERL